MKKLRRSLRSKFLPLLVTILLAFSASAQIMQPVNGYGEQRKRIGIDSLLWLPGDTLSGSQTTAQQKAHPMIAVKGSSVYFWIVSLQKWVGMNAGGSTFDTTAIYAAINTKLAKSDTTGKWVQNVVSKNDSTITVYKNGIGTDIIIRGPSNVFTPGRDTLVIQGDTIYVHTTDSIYVVGTVDPSLSNKLDSVHITTGICDTLDFYANGAVVNQYINCKPDVCSDGPGGVITSRPGTLIIDASPWASYCINGTSYSSSGGAMTLVADTLDRWVSIVFNTSGGVEAILGDPAVSPLPPDYDPTTQKLKASFILRANATEVDNVVTNIIYDENVEWSHTTSGTIVTNFASTTRAFNGSKSIRVDSWGNGGSITFTYSDYIAAGDLNTLAFHYWLNGTLKANNNVLVQALKDGAPASSPITPTISKLSVNSWQGTASLLGAFSSPTYNQIRITFTNTNTNDVYLDLIYLQGGIDQTGGSTGLQNAVTSVSGNTGSAPAVGNANLAIKSTNGLATVNALPNPTAPGILAEITVSGAAIRNSLDTAFVRLSDSAANRLQDSYWRNDSNFVRIAGVEYFRYDNGLIVRTPQFGGSGTIGSPLYIKVTSVGSAPAYAIGYDPADSSLKYYTWPTGAGAQTTSNQTVWIASGTTVTFASVPSSYDDFSITRNGITLTPLVHYTKSGNVITITGGEVGDRIQMHRVK